LAYGGLEASAAKGLLHTLLPEDLTGPGKVLCAVLTFDCPRAASAAAMAALAADRLCCTAAAAAAAALKVDLLLLLHLLLLPAP
jgi:hypothetical protein